MLVQSLSLKDNQPNLFFHLQRDSTLTLELIRVRLFAFLHKKTASPYEAIKNSHLPSAADRFPF